MARAFLLSATPENDRTDFNLAPLSELRKSAALDPFGIHSQTADPAAADLIIFVEFYGGGWYFERVRKHPLVKRYREKCFLFCANPLVIPFLPGVYSGLERRWATSRTRAGFYLGRTKNEFTTYTSPTADLPYLFSFMGSVRNAPVRAKLATLRHRRSFFRDTAEDFERILDRRMSHRERLDYDRRYADVTRASKFVLCPRGLSPSSIRLFETMQMGRVPVILADTWVPPVGPCWERFAIQVPEKDFTRLPPILEEREDQAVEMGELARAEWERWFSEEVLFHHLVELCLDIQRDRTIPEALARWSAYVHYLRPFHFRRMLGRLVRTFWRTGRTEATDPQRCPQ
ncbi:MAG: hypothetical protein QOI07_2784 [Verrucomicrobiota bacterium]|jgi:hypothetical protein